MHTWHSSMAYRIVIGITIVIAFLFGSNTLYGQASTANYTCAADSASSFVDMSPGTTQLYGGGIDSYIATLQTLPFNFTFMGTTYTQFSASPDFSVWLGSTVITGNTQSPAANQAKLVLLNADVRTALGIGKVHYKVIGTAPNRQLVVEWLNLHMYWSGVDTATDAKKSSAQMILNEGTGVIKYVYGNMYNNNTSVLAANVFISSSNAENTIGWIGNVTTTRTYNTAATLTTTSLPATSIVIGLSGTTDGSRYGFTFTPPVAPAAPTSLSFTSVGLSGMTLNWVDAANELGYRVERSSDAGATWVVAGTALQNAVSFAATGLNSGITYQWRVIAETFPLVFTNINTSATNTLTIRPASDATGLVITSADLLATISMFEFAN